MIPELKEFDGLWRLKRDVMHEGAPPAQFDGKADFSPYKDGVLYREEGQLRVAGQMPMHAERAYHWQPGAEGGIDVFFEDGRFFHSIATEAEHWCAPDMYRVRYDFADWPVWSTTWDVRGPRKAYRMFSQYTR